MSKKIAKTRVMVIDDDETSLRLMTAMLIPNGYDVLPFHEGKNVIQAIHNQMPDIILLDVMMPDVSGYTVLNAIKYDERLKDIPVIMVTSVKYELNKKLADGLGADGYITKPIELSCLLRTINNLLPTNTISEKLKPSAG
jgi:DNA-binding response OmpR family regulator